MNYIEQVRRTDFNLRAEYAEIVTEIIQYSDSKFIIYCQGEIIDFAALQYDFERNIRPISLVSILQLSETKPASVQAIIPGIADEDIAQGFAGLSHSNATLLNLLLAKFPNVPFHYIDDKGPVLRIYTTTYEEQLGDTTRIRFLNHADKVKVQEFVSGLGLGIPFEIQEKPGQGSDALLSTKALNPV